MGERAQIVVQVAVVLGVLAAAVFGVVSSVTSEPPKVAASTPTAPDASLIASTVRSPSAAPARTQAPSPLPTFATLPPTPGPTPTPRPIVLSTYSLNGRVYTGVEAAPGTVFVAPFDARVEVVVYQIIDGEFRSETDVAGIPSYPYVFLHAPDRIMKLRPGALKTDTEILVRESQVKAGALLFRVIGTGPSSWHDRYDATVGAQVIVSLENGAGADLDAAPFVKTR